MSELHQSNCLKKTLFLKHRAVIINAYFKNNYKINNYFALRKSTDSRFQIHLIIKTFSANKAWFYLNGYFNL